jgi:hypothetical protein
MPQFCFRQLAGMKLLPSLRQQNKNIYNAVQTMILDLPDLKYMWQWIARQYFVAEGDSNSSSFPTRESICAFPGMMSNNRFQIKFSLFRDLYFQQIEKSALQVVDCLVEQHNGFHVHD